VSDIRSENAPNPYQSKSDQETLRKLIQRDQEKKRKEIKKSFAYWTALYVFISWIIWYLNRDNSGTVVMEQIGTWVIVCAALLISVTTLAGTTSYAVPTMMVVSDKNLGVVSSIQNARRRMYETISGPVLGFVYGILCIVISIQL
jgi:hypothetical protein